MRKFTSIIASLILASCASSNVEYKYPKSQGEIIQERRGSMITGDYSSFTFGESNKDKTGPNQILWKASLETLSFMPLASTDSAGGVIVTEWYSPKDNKNERIKINVMILSSKLSASALKVTAFREILVGSKWVSSPSSKEFISNLENQILSKAKKIHLGSR